ncbi:carbon-nitrogen hydrolase family protein [Motiliproteus sp.]|uniref:carbon-nitrogen hydrolase family protein n=1 Tax=Motiliproteus sp. TaxID=1898955 RepID=UPI003BA8530F
MPDTSNSERRERPAIVAAVQLISGGDWRHNLERAAHWIAEAASRGAELVLLPENFAVFNTSMLIERGREELSPEGPIRQFLSQQAKQHGIWLVAGSLPILNQAGDRVRAACLVVDDQGRECARYDKLHLFDVDVGDSQGRYRESDEIEPGEALVLVDTPVGRLGLTICYDLRFPELYQALRAQGAELVSVPAAFTQVTGEAHWEVLLRARAIENQCFVIASNQGGVHNAKRETYGHSMIVDPWGERLDCLEKGEGLVLAELDLERQQQLRRQMPVVSHQRPELFRDNSD